MKTDERVLLVGGGGFIGRNLLEGLLAKGVALVCYDRFKPSWLPSEVSFVAGDYQDFSTLEVAVSQATSVVHLISTTLPKGSNEDPIFDVTSNLVGSLRLLEMARKASIRRFVFLSSGGTVYGQPVRVPIAEAHPTDPICSYGIVKLAIEKYLRLYHELHGLSTCSLRLSNPYGRFQRFDTGQGVVATFCQKALTGQPIEIWGDGTVSRDFLAIEDVVEAVICSLERTDVIGEINVGSGTSETLNTLLAHIESILERKVEVRYLPGRNFDVTRSELDVTAASSRLGWVPRTSFLEGVRRTVAWQKGELAKAGSLA